MKALLTATAAVVAVALLPLSGAHAACHLAIPTAIVCASPSVAAVAFRRYGNDGALIQKPYTQDLLHGSHCRTYANAATHDVKLMQVVKVPLSDGYETVATVSIDDKDLWYVHTKYLAGMCDPFRPTFSIGVPCDAGPGHAACEQRAAEMIEKAKANGDRIQGDTGH